MKASSKAEVPSSFDLDSKPSWNPLRCTGTGLPTNLTILVKSLAIAVLVTNHVILLPDPWLSFIPALDAMPPALFKTTLQVVFVVSALAILFNRKIQLASLAIGTTMLVAVVSSKAYYGNNKTFCGLMFFLVGLYKPGGLPFIRWQLALTYFGAGLNKLLDPDWQTGVFFEFWAVHKLHEYAYIALDNLLPRLWLGRLMCWFTIAIELGVVPFLLVPEFYFWGALLNVLFQCGLCMFVGDTFTLFFYSMNVASLAFITWPAKPMIVSYAPGKDMRLCKLLRGADLDGRLDWLPKNEGQFIGGAVQIALTSETRVYEGFNAVRMMILYNPATYLIFTVAMGVAGYRQSLSFAIYRRILLGLTLTLLLPPLAWFIDLVRGGKKQHPDFTMGQETVGKTT